MHHNIIVHVVLYKKSSSSTVLSLLKYIVYGHSYWFRIHSTLTLMVSDVPSMLSYQTYHSFSITIEWPTRVLSCAYIHRATLRDHGKQLEQWRSEETSRSENRQCHEEFCSPNGDIRWLLPHSENHPPTELC